MSDQKPDSTIKQTIDAATELTKAVPIYQDAIQPLAKETGKALGKVGKAVNVALAPLSMVIWGYDKIQDFLEQKVSEKLENTPKERISTPPGNVAGPAIEALKFVGQDETLQEMFANLIANSMDTDTTLEAHPSFVDIIKSLTADEGRILKYFQNQGIVPLIDIRVNFSDRPGFQTLKSNHSYIGEKAKCQNITHVPNYLDNLCRLGLLRIPGDRFLTKEDAYDELLNSELFKEIQKINKNEFNDKHSIESSKKVIENN